MKVVLFCRDGLAARYLAHELHQEDPLTAILVETGAAARRRKLGRSWRRTPWWHAPLLLLDLAALAVYGRTWGRILRRRLSGHPALDGYPEGVGRWVFDDANEPAAVERLRSLEPDVMVVFGTAILGSEILAIPRRAALNVHGGIVPGYRNVHSEVWAVLRGEPAEIGTSILHLDEGIDSGAIALQRRIERADASDFFELRWRNLVLAGQLAREAVRRVEEGTLPRQPQEHDEAGFYPTPGARELLRLWRSEHGG